MTAHLPARIALAALAVVCVWGALEALSWPYRAAFEPRWIQPGLVERDPYLGWRLRPRVSVDASCQIGVRTIYEVRYVTDSAGRRAVPDAADLAVLGGSFAFGQGVEQHETAAARLGAYNYGVPGWSPAVVLADLHRRPLPAEVHRVVLILIADHVRRVIGAHPWTHGQPHYHLDGDQVEHVGVVRDAHPMRSAWWTVLGRSRLLWSLGVGPPLGGLQAQHRALTAAVVAAIGEEVARPMVVALFDTAPVLEVALRRRGLDVLDVSGGPMLADGHPSAAAHALAAARIAHHLSTE